MCLILFSNHHYLFQVVRFVLYNIVAVQWLLSLLKLILDEVFPLNAQNHVHIYVEDHYFFVFQYLIPK